MYFYNGAAKIYVNVASDGEHYNLKLESTPSTEWHYNETYKCPMTNVDGELMFIGTSDTGTYTNLCIKRISDGPTFFKLQFISAGVSDGGNDNDGECKHADVEIVGCEKVCNDCGVALGTEHSGETTIDKDTCDILCAACGRFLREGTHKLEIDIDDNCNYKCVLCGHVEEEGRHQELVVETRDPTASSEGWMITRCKDCNAIVSEDTIPPLGILAELESERVPRAPSSSIPILKGKGSSQNRVKRKLTARERSARQRCLQNLFSVYFLHRIPTPALARFPITLTQ